MPSPDRWSGRTGFVLATIGSAVGIGSIWKFPYELGANGGSAFLLFYLIGLVAVVVPLMLAEFAIGRRGGGDPDTSIAAVAVAHGAHPGWRLAGVAGVVTGFLILSFYAVVGGWTIGYAFQFVVEGLPEANAPEAKDRFQAFLSSPWRVLGWHGAFMAATALVVGRGVSGGIETAMKVLMPLLVALMIALAAYALAQGDVAATLRFLFRLDASRIDARTVIEALGLGFFSIGVGMGLMITYAAYSGREIRLVEVAVVSVVADTAISMLAGLAVFPIVFAHDLDPASGPDLVFVTLPLAFADMPLGRTAAIGFFVLLFVAALGSAISMLELVVATLVRRLRWSRRQATLRAALACFAAGVPTVLSFNAWSGWFPLAGLPGFERATFYELVDALTSNVLLAAGGLAIALFAGWALPAGAVAGELRLSPRGATLLRVVLRWVTPASIAAAALAPLVLRD